MRCTAILAVIVGTVTAILPAEGQTVILDGKESIWRTLVGCRTPVVLAADGQSRPLVLQDHFWMPAEGPKQKPVPQWSSPPAADDWTAVEFDDSAWSPDRCPIGPAFNSKKEASMWSVGGAAHVDAMWVRGRFNVVDPAKAGPMKLALTFRGGAVVRLNGREIARANMPAGQLTRDTLAEPYPDDAYLNADGKALVGEATDKSTDDEKARFAKRDRTLTVAVPADGLIKGVNVLAIELRRAGYKELGLAEPHDYRGAKYRMWPSPWPHCRLLDVSLSAEGEGVSANVGRPAGVQLWQPQPLATVTDFDYGDPYEPVRPIRIDAVRNAVFTNQLVVSATQPITGLKATATQLQSPDGAKLGAQCIRLRFPQPGDNNRFDAIIDRAPAEVPLRDCRPTRQAPAQKIAMQPVWVTVEVPSDAAAGQYAAAVTVEADGLPARQIPVHVNVHNWQMPQPKDYATHNNLWQSHETSALSHRVPLWSDRHFELLSQSLALSIPLANKYCNVHLVTQAFFCGNSESMVRWIPKDGGGFDYDFSVFDRYLDTYSAAMGKPVVLMIDVCVSIHSGNRPKDGSNPVKVSRLDPKTGKVEPMAQPPYNPPTGVEFWKPVLTEVQKRLEKRGWWDVTVIGTASDSGPTEGEAQTFKEIWPDRPWIFSGHPHAKSVAKGIAEVRALEWVWGAGKLWSPAEAKPDQKYPRPWTRLPQRVQVAFPRLGSGSCELYNSSLLSEYRVKPEKAMQSNENGLGRTGLDFWPFTDEKGNRRQVCQSGGQFSFNGGVAWLVAMGPDGPVITTRGQMFREGIQTAEAIAFLGKSIDSGKLPADLAQRAETLLRQRAETMLLVDGQRSWQADEARLFALCAEVAGKLP